MKLKNITMEMKRGDKILVTPKVLSTKFKKNKVVEFQLYVGAGKRPLKEVTDAMGWESFAPKGRTKWASGMDRIFVKDEEGTCYLIPLSNRNMIHLKQVVG